jgi:16S rRNA (cytosine1402-N4)-methyltransferase
MDREHLPVLLDEVVEFISCKEGGNYVDATIGSGGHAWEILKRCPKATLVGIDRDAQAVAIAKKNLKIFGNRVIVIQGNFEDIKNILGTIHIFEIDGILFDFGVSTFQLKDPKRGFSFTLEGPLDMRMDQNIAVQAKDLVNNLSVKELTSIFQEYGEERWSKNIARHIYKRRLQRPIHSTKELSEIIVQAIPAKYHPKKIHPATKAFQALRIVVNNELLHIQNGLNECIDLLKAGGRICVISFHSLEDRIVKHTFRRWQKGCSCPPRIPQCLCGGSKTLTILTKKPIIPTQQEKERNPKSRSAKLRAGEKIRNLQ